MIESLLPGGVASYETWTAEPDSVPFPEDLFPEEQAHVANAVPKRVEEFRLGRACARRALARSGHDPVAIGVLASRGPRWPDGIVGSITHCQGYAAAAVGPATYVAGIGIDAEPDRPLPSGVSERITSERERAWVRCQPASIAADTLLFSIKESVYKVWAPITNAWLGFEEAEIEADLSSGTFVATIAPARVAEFDGVPPQLSGRFTQSRGLLITAIVLPR